MTSVEVGLLLAVALLTVLVAGLLRDQARTRARLDLVERRLARTDRAFVSPDPEPGEAVPRAGEPKGDAVDIRGVSVTGEPVTVCLEEPEDPTLVAFLSTSCGICTSLWERLRDEGLAGVAPGVVPVVVTKDPADENRARVHSLATDDGLRVVQSGEAWIDYEVPGSPYFMLVAGNPGSVVAEGAVNRWDDLAAMAAKASNLRR